MLPAQAQGFIHTGRGRGVDILAFALGWAAQTVGWPANKSRNPCKILQEWSRKGSRDHS